MGLCKVVEINQSKCVNCHICISVCPIKYCFKNEKTVQINDDLCIGCGRCYQSCPHDAINIIDDFQIFLDTVNKGEEIFLIVSPAIQLSFKNNHRKLLTFLKEHFVLKGIFDEGIGAEISSTLYMREMKKTANIPMISQQCPSIVEYIKIYKPELLNNIALIHSPVVVLSKLIRKIYRYNGIIAYLGPCLSKRREFKDPDTNNIIQFNLTIENLKNYIKNKNINLNKYENGDYDYIKSERGSVFCKPGGFINIIKRYYENPRMINYEGYKIYSKYLNNLSINIEKNKKFLPLLIDLLNCNGGCYHGPASDINISIEEEKYLLEKLEDDSINKFENKFKVQKIFDKIIDDNMDIEFERVYFSDSEKAIYTLKKNELNECFILLNKSNKRDFLDCRACGFNNCLEFATSYYYKLNKPENCRYYIEKKLNSTISQNRGLLLNLGEIINNINSSVNSISKIVFKLNEIQKGINNQTHSIDQQVINLQDTTEQFNPIITALTELSEQINLLSLNASIEASRTGDAGKGFSVVSMEIRNLADKTKIETSKLISIMKIVVENILGTNEDINKLTIETIEYTGIVENLDNTVNDMKNKIKEIKNTIDEISNITINK